MPAFGFGLVWFGYSLASYGYFLVRGYDVKFSDWLNPVHPYPGNPSKAGPIPKSQIFPTGKASTSTATSTGKIL